MIWLLGKEIKLTSMNWFSILFSFACKFTYSFLATTAWHTFSRLERILNKGEGEFLVSLSKSNIFLRLFHEATYSFRTFLIKGTIFWVWVVLRSFSFRNSWCICLARFIAIRVAVERSSVVKNVSAFEDIREVQLK